MTENLKILTLKGHEIIPYISELAQLRISIFRNYPYLYDGNLEYEKDYLQTYIKCPESVMVLVLAEKKIVGASTAIPMEFETNEFQKPFLEHSSISISDIFYLGESLLKYEYRGRNLYRHFFRERETSAKKYGCHYTAFAAVERSFNDSRKPQNYVSLDEAWTHFGYIKKPELCAYLTWKEVDEKTESPKPLIFWVKKLNHV